MAVDLPALLTALRTDPEAREAIRRELLTEDLLALPARTDARFAEVGLALEQLTARMDQLTQRMDQLAVAQAKTEERLGQLVAVVERMGGEMSRLVGADYEGEILATPDGVEEAVGAAFGTVHRLAPEELTAHLGKAIADGRITPQAARDVRRANGVFVWERGNGEPLVYCVVEASVTGQARDVERVTRRAAELALTGVQTLAIVLGDHPDPVITPAIEARRILWHQVEPKRPVPQF